MNRAIYPPLFCLLLSVQWLIAQSDYTLLLHNGMLVLPEDTKSHARLTPGEGIDATGGKYYRLLQFYHLPDEAGHSEIARQGIELLEYLPHNTYLASIPPGIDPGVFVKTGVRSIQPIDPAWKVAENLKTRPLPDWAREDKRLLVKLKYYRNLDHDQVLRFCEANDIQVLRHNGYNNFLRVSVPEEKIEAIAALPFVAFVELVAPPPVPDDHLGRSLHRANAIDSQFPGGRRYRGEGVNVLVRDDGAIGPHIDFQGRVDNSLVEPQLGTHGDGVAGILCAAGNLDPRMRGMATGAHLFVLNYESDFLDETMDLFYNSDVIITNSSYSNGCNDGYTGTTETVDQQLYDNPTLMHVFSGGNSNNLDCGYGAGTQWGNITGGHKMAKNCLAVANLFADATLANSSSRGPAHDGRIKPDIAANGQNQNSTTENNQYQVFGGTSGASPGIAGILAQLHQAYREKHDGKTADAALLKALLLNTANDLGNKGPDFKFGWGHVNAYKAALALEEERYLKTVVSPGQINSHTIQIPPGIGQTRIMVYWMDPPASVMTSKALINDIDITLQDPDGNKHLPWVLDHTPNPDKLDLPATKGVDMLNNMEQISIDNPPAGTYQLLVNGKTLPFGPREYFVTWDFRSSDITVTHPIGGESFSPGDTVRIHWDTEGQAQFFILSVSTDGGNSWSTITTAQAHQRMRDWVVPQNMLSGHCKIRVSRATLSDESDYEFSIAPRPANLKVEKACPDFIRFSWDKVNIPDSLFPQYQVFILGDQYMEPVATVTENFFELSTINQDPSLDYWFAVRAIANDGIFSEQTIAILHNSGLLDCVQTHDLSLVSVQSPPHSFYVCEQPVSVLITNSGLVPQSNFKVIYQAGQLPPVVEYITQTLEPGDTAVYTFNTPITSLQTGVHVLQAYVDLDTDMARFNDTAVHEVNAILYPGGAEPLNYAEDFEQEDFPPTLFFLNNPDGLYTWASAKVIGITGDSTRCARMNNSPYISGQLDELVVVPVDLSGAQNAYLRFDVAYARRNATRQDGLRVEISTDCGTTFPDVVYEKIGTALATVPDQVLAFFPDEGSDWRTEQLNLEGYLGKSIVVKFVNICGRGNNLFLDNINVETVVSPVAGFTLSTGEICQDSLVTFSNASTGGSLMYKWDFGQDATPQASNSPGPVKVVFHKPGDKNVKLTVTNFAGTSTFESDVFVKPLPSAVFTYSVNDLLVAFTNASTNVLSFLWNFGDNAGLDTVANPVYSYAQSGVYTVTLTAYNDCGFEVLEQEVLVGTVAVDDPVRSLGVRILPNPNKGEFRVRIEGEQHEIHKLELRSPTGVLLHSAAVLPGQQELTLPFGKGKLPAGVYFLQVSSGAGRAITKVVVK